MAKRGRPGVLDDANFIRMFEEMGAAKMAVVLGMNAEGISRRRLRLEGHINRQIVSPVTPRNNVQTRVGVAHPGRVEHDVRNGIVLVASDAHYWPGAPSVMHRALVWACKEYKPALVIMNGDVVDMAAVSRHPPIGWETQPTVQSEIETAQDRLHEIASACLPHTQKVWTLGNHDGRFETRLATVAPEYAKVHGVHLRDHFPLWEPCWSTWINDSVVVKHRFKGGDHATFNNTIKAGKSMVTGHLHSAQVRPFTDYNGTRFGVDAGCVADTTHRAFVDYTEDNPKNWISAFAKLTFRDGVLLWPELVVKWDEHSVQFRGEIVAV